jgi:hypothetical protein
MLDRLLAHRRRVDTGGTAKRRGDALLSEPEVGFDLTGRDAFEADALRAELLRERFRDVQKRRLRHPVVDHHPVGLEEGIDGDDVDHRSLTTEKHRRNRHARCAHVSKEVELQRRLEVGIADLEEPVEPKTHPTHVVDEDIDASAPLDRLAHELLRPARLGQFHRNRAEPFHAGKRIDREGSGNDFGPFRDESAYDVTCSLAASGEPPTRRPAPSPTTARSRRSPPSRSARA